MKPELASFVWWLPGARSFVRRTGQALRDGISLLCLFLSCPEVSNFQDQLLQHLEQELALNVRLVDLSCVNGGSPFEILQELLLERNAHQYLEQMVPDPGLPNVVLVSHFEGCSKNQIQGWVQSLARWGEACRSSGSLNSLALLMTADQAKGIKLPDNDVRLSYKIWPGAPSALDVRMLCRYISDETDAEAQWREHILASLAGSDLLLAEYLWEHACEPVDQILIAVEQFAHNCKWSLDEIRSQMKGWRPIPAGQPLTLKPNANGFNVTCSGWTVYTPEYGEEIHTAALMLLGRSHEVIHRIWRAQAALILPMIDEIRRRISDYLTAQFISRKAAVENEPCNNLMEMGELKVYFDKLPAESWEKKQWGRGVNLAWQIRNELAHYEPVSYAAFREIWRLNNSVHCMLHKFT